LKISVIIATRNRADALEKISLPSLAKQDFKDFEVIIWDASDDDKSKIVVENFIQSHPDMIVRYFKAPRVGSASQRNDAVKVARGMENIVLLGFIQVRIDSVRYGLACLRVLKTKVNSLRV